MKNCTTEEQWRKVRNSIREAPYDERPKYKGSAQELLDTTSQKETATKAIFGGVRKLGGALLKTGQTLNNNYKKNTEKYGEMPDLFDPFSKKNKGAKPPFGI